MSMIVSLADVRANLSALVDKVKQTHERVTITRHGQADAVLISVEDLESMEETLDILSDAGLMADIRRAEAELDRGESVPLAEVLREFRPQASGE